MTKQSNNTFLHSAAVLLITLVVYLLTAAPGVTFTDAGELAGVCSTLGVAHPTGYPLFTILGYLWSLLPISETPVYELNLFAAFLVAVGNFVFFYAFKEILSIFSSSLKHKISDITKNVYSAVTVLTLGFGSVIWDQATAVEVYSLHYLMISLILLAGIKAYRKQNKKLFLTAAFLTGLSFANHMTTLLILPVIFYLYFAEGDKPYFTKDKFKFLLYLIIPFMIGLSLYISLPLISSTDPLFNWGDVSRSWDKFLYHVQGKQYQVWMFSDSESWGKNLSKFFASLPGQTAWFGIIVMLVGLYVSFSRSRKLFWLGIIIIFSNLLYSLNYSIHDIETYFISAYVGIAIFMLFGFAVYLKNNKYTYFTLIIPLFGLIFNYSYNDRSNENYVDSYTQMMVDNLEEDALIISSEWDYWCSSFWYKQAVEGLRPDIQLVELELMRRTWYPGMVKRWYPDLYKQNEKEFAEFIEYLEKFESDKEYDGNTMQRYFESVFISMIEKNIDKRPVYVTHDIMQNEQGIVANYIPIAEGLAVRLYKDPKKAKFKPVNIDIEEFINSINKRQNHLTEGIIMTLESKIGIMNTMAKQANMQEASSVYSNQVNRIRNKYREVEIKK